MGKPRAKVKRGFGEVGQLPSGRYRARYTGPDGSRHSAPITFVARIDAEGWLVDQERMISRGEWEPPARQVREVRGGAPAAGSVRRHCGGPPADSAGHGGAVREAAPVDHPSGVREAASGRDHRSGGLDLVRGDAEHADPTGQRLRAAQVDLQGGPRGAARGGEPVPREGGHAEGAAREDRGAHRRPSSIATWPPFPKRGGCRCCWPGGAGCVPARSEGLRVRDLDLDLGLVHVRQAVVRLNGQLLIGPPKTDAGIGNSVSIPPHLLPSLREWAARQPVREREALLFPARDGHSPLNDSVLRVAHNKGEAAIDMHGLTVHGLRHTSATLAAPLGATLAELQARDSNSTPNMAMRYQHVAAERDAQLAARMSAFATGRPA